jgi:hypothetical protein
MNDPWDLLDECRDFVQHCVGSSYHETDKDDDAFLARLEAALASRPAKGGAN